MFDKIKELNRFKKMQGEMKKELEQIFASVEKNGMQVVIRGDRRIERIVIEGEEDKKLKETINDAMKEVDKKVEKQMRGKLGDLGLPGL